MKKQVNLARLKANLAEKEMILPTVKSSLFLGGGDPSLVTFTEKEYDYQG